MGGLIEASRDDRLFAQPQAVARPRRTALKLWLLFSAELLVFALIRLPLVLSLDSYAFADRGMFPTVCYLVTHGHRPGIDFGYPYGLLPIMLTQGVFHLLRWSPAAHEAAMGICGLASAWGMARFASAMRLRRIGIAFLVAAFPFAVLASYPSFVHALEAAVLCNALAEQAAGRRGNALALVTAACMTKPAMGYLYGFVLLLLILLEARRRSAAAASRIDWRAVLRTLAPAALTGVILLMLLAAFYGADSLVKSLVPGTGSFEYRRMGLGSVFYGGRGLWYHPGNPQFYLFTVSGFWISSTLWLAACGVRAAWKLARWERTEPAAASEEFVLTCAVLHIAFIIVFFGTATSWEYYSYLLVMGVAATSVWDAVSAKILAAIALLALSGHTAHLAMAAGAWRSSAPSPTTAGLFAPAEERTAWAQVLQATSGRNAAALISAGEVSVLFAQFQPPFGAYLAPGVTLEPELAHAMHVASDASVVFTVTSGSLGYALDFYPRLRQVLQRRRIILEVVRKGGTFTVYGAPKPR